MIYLLAQVIPLNPTPPSFETDPVGNLGSIIDLAFFILVAMGLGLTVIWLVQGAWRVMKGLPFKEPPPSPRTKQACTCDWRHFRREEVSRFLAMRTDRPCRATPHARTLLVESNMPDLGVY